ncbi:MAG TPA: hypothetical protein VEP90_02295 [Methylomirabilota bacterium]|nr:hypothetical protein [Methylomirabilota bacterium]
MPQTIESRHNNAFASNSLIARGVSADSKELLKKAQQSFDVFLGSSEVIRDYSLTFRRNTETNSGEMIINKAFNDILVEIGNLLTWQDGWNGYDIPAPRLSAIMHATSWISKFYYLVTGLDWISPNVTAGSQGEIVFEWWRGVKKLTVYISNRNAEYVQVWGPDINTDMNDGDAEPIETCRMLWVWLRT